MTPIRIAPDAPVIYVDSIEAAAALARLTSKRLVWREGPRNQEPQEKRDE